MLKRPKGNADDGGSGGDYVGEHVGACGVAREGCEFGRWVVI